MTTREELEKIPRRYRWLVKLFLKVPNPSLLSKFPGVQGVFWAIVVPIFLTGYFLFSVWLIALLSSFVAFPFNFLLILLIPSIIFVIFLRIIFERTAQWWRNIQAPIKEWDIAKATEELLEILKKQQMRTGDAE